MAYSTASPPSLMSMAPLASKGRFWFYTSTDAIATVNTTGYITNGGDLGMKVGDSVIVEDTTTPLQHIARVVSVNATTGAVDLSDGASLGANTD